MVLADSPWVVVVVSPIVVLGVPKPKGLAVEVCPAIDIAVPSLIPPLAVLVPRVVVV